MSQNKKFWARLKSIKNILAYLSVITAFAGGVVTLFFKEIDPIPLLLLAVGFLGGDTLAERLVMLSDIEENVKFTAEAVADIKTAVENVEMNVFSDDTEITELILNLSDSTKLKEAQILSSGLTSRQIMITKLLQKGIRVQVLMQDPSTAL